MDDVNQDIYISDEYLLLRLIHLQFERVVFFFPKIFQFKDRSGEIGTDWSLVEKKKLEKERSTTGRLCAENTYVQLLPKFPVELCRQEFPNLMETDGIYRQVF